MNFTFLTKFANAIATNNDSYYGRFQPWLQCNDMHFLFCITDAQDEEPPCLSMSLVIILQNLHANLQL